MSRTTESFVSWLPIYANLPDHPKTMALAEILGVPSEQIVGMVIRLWHWSLVNNLMYIKDNPFAIAEVMHWHGDKKKLRDGLLACKFLDLRDDDVISRDDDVYHAPINSLLIHNWIDYAGKLLDHREAHAKASKEYRNRLKQAQNTPENRDSHVIVTSLSRVVDVINNSNSNSNSNSNGISTTKEMDKESDLNTIFFTFKKDTRYTGVDFDNEFKKFKEYWLEGHRKLVNKKLACHNWLDKCLERNNGKPIPGGVPDPDKYVKGKYGHMVQR